MIGFVAAAMAAVAVGCGGEGGNEPGGPAVTESTSAGLEAVDCKTLSDKLQKLRVEVESCNPAGSFHQCNIALEDVCCPITANGGPIEDFKNAVAEYKASCNYACTAVVCHKPPSGVCLLSGSCQQ
jgi:hypothetical protein